jgi:hypothetical protein
MYAAAAGMRYRYAAQSSSGFLHYLFVKNFIRWDSWWLTGIAGSGYTPKATAFYPLYPLLIRGVSEALRVSLQAAPSAWPGTAPDRAAKPPRLAPPC